MVKKIEEDDKHKAIEKHHPDYDYPLIIVSVCKDCHVVADRTTMENVIVPHPLEIILL